ncbi:MAG: ABC transporter ATP-binding protein [Thermodesulfobacteriota bacterium]
MALLEIKNLEKSFDQPAVRDISLNLEQGRILCLLGPSGCGKTTLLRLIAGLEQPDQGKICFEGRDVSHKPAHLRQFGMMFQEFALFPHKNVFENVAFGLQMLNLDAARVEKQTMAMLDLTGLAELKQRNVAELSGGERQRVALARSLAPSPRLLMLDEPLGSLDRALRERLLIDIRSILKELQMTAIFVTHDQSEAFRVADTIAVMNNGRVVQTGTPESLYMRPKSLFVARFLGFKNLLPGMVVEGGGIKTALGTLYPANADVAEGHKVTLLIRPESAGLAQSREPDVAAGIIAGRVTGSLFIGQSYRVRVAIEEDTELTFDLPNLQPPPLGREVVLQINPEMMRLIPELE